MKMLSKLMVGQLAVIALFCVKSFSQTSTAQTSDAPSAALSELKYDHVSLSVQDMDREIEWYTRVLGFRETKRLTRGPMLNVNMSNGNMRIDLIKYTGSARTPADPVYMQQGWAHLALIVPDIPSAFAALKALNANATGGKGNIVLRDPEGNEMEIFPATPAAPAAPQNTPEAPKK